jgi:hypothetical protein
MSEKQFEVLLAQSLNEQGFTSSLNFRLKTETKGKYFELGLYISSPVRAFVETVQWNKITPTQVERLKRGILETVVHFRGRVVPFIIGFGEPSLETRTQFDDFPAELIDVSDDTANPLEFAARSIRNVVAHGQYSDSGRYSESVVLVPKGAVNAEHFSADPIFEAGAVADVLVSFRGLIAEDQFDALRHEISELIAEFESKHYTSGALRIGRALEFVFYTLANSWNVPINKSNLFVLNDLQNALDAFKASYLNHVTAEENSRPDTKRLVQSSSEVLNKKLSALAFSVDDDHQFEQKDTIINIHSILLDIKKHFGRNRDIREEVEALIAEKLVRQLLHSRNQAAHADSSGSRREVSKKDLEKMIEDFREVIFRLSNIASIAASM